MSIGKTLVAEFKHEAANTRKVLEAVPEDRFDWKPHEKSMTLGQLAAHIAETPTWVRSMIEDELDFAVAGGDYKPFAPATKAELLAGFDENVKDFETTVAGRDDEFLGVTWTMRHGDKVLMSVPRHVAMRSTAINHIIHHRGQLTVYLRLLDAPVPPTYGPTADNASFA